LFVIAVAAIGIILLAVQWASGAWHAEFDGDTDESTQFVSGRMLWEYVRSLPPGNPIDWAGQYYRHYPKVTIGHWPAAYHLTEASWSLVFGSSRASAMGLHWFLGLAALVGLYALARPRLPLSVTIGIVLFTIATPVLQRGLEQAMADIGSCFASLQ
jgi:hypothetical protein